MADAINAMGQKAKVFLGDVSDKSACNEMARAFLAAFGQVDAIVNNAGILIAGEVDGLAEAHWDRVMDINAKGPFLVIQAFLPAMKVRGYGRIVNIASIGGKHGAPEQAHYSASKAAVMGFSRVLAQEVGSLGITVNCVCPGIILTDMGAGQPRGCVCPRRLAGQDGACSDRGTGRRCRSGCIFLFG